MHNRRQRVTLREFTSDSFVATSGVPQGSNLGPLLFLLFINSLTEVIKKLLLFTFADDLKLHSRINNEQGCLMLQNELDRNHHWSLQNRLGCNFDKYVVVSLSRIKNIIAYDYYMNSSASARVREVTKLRVTFDSELSFRGHFTQIINRASKMYGFVIRNTRQLRNR